jgi:hypothetical protein
MKNSEKIQETKLKIAHEWFKNQKNGLKPENFDFLSRFFLGDSRFVYFSDKISYVDEEIALEIIKQAKKDEKMEQIEFSYPKIYHWAATVFFESDKLKKMIPEIDKENKRKMHMPNFTRFLFSPLL